MKIQIEVDESAKETEVIIKTPEMTEEVNMLILRLSEQRPNLIIGFQNDTAEILDEAKLIRVYSAGGKIYADTEHGNYTVRLRLYELEQRLDHTTFVRISNSEIINLKKVKGFDLSFAGTICVTFHGGTSTYVSRRYVSTIKKLLGI